MMLDNENIILDKAYLKQLLKEEKYEDIFQYFSHQYEKLLVCFLKQHGQEVDHHMSLHDLILKVKHDFPKYASQMQLMTNNVWNDQDDRIESLHDMIDTYHYLYNELT